MKKSLLLSLLLLTLCGCLAHQTRLVTLTNSYNSEETQKLLRKGNNTIKGSALLRQMGGGVVTCAGYNVYLTPVTAYSQERMVALYGSDSAGFLDTQSYRMSPVEFTNEDPRYQNEAALSSICDAQGYFTFSKLADGDYYIQTYVLWTAGLQEGGRLMKKVHVSGGETVEVVLTR